MQLRRQRRRRAAVCRRGRMNWRHCPLVAGWNVSVVFAGSWSCGCLVDAQHFNTRLAQLVSCVHELCKRASALGDSARQLFGNTPGTHSPAGQCDCCWLAVRVLPCETSIKPQRRASKYTRRIFTISVLPFPFPVVAAAVSLVGDSSLEMRDKLQN